MTTIAWDGVTLAADTLALSGCVRDFQRKVFRIAQEGVPNVRLYGFSGETQVAHAVKNWLNAGGNISTGKDAPSMEKDDFSGIVIDADGRCYHLQNRCIGIPITAQRYYAVGSGREMALTAMLLGKDAVEAVRCAAVFDPYTGGGVHSVQLHGEVQSHDI
jgi:hypothetical protein